MNSQTSNPQNSPTAALGIVLFGHGSRDPNWRLPMEAVAAQIRSRAPATPVVCAYLELCEPSLPDAAAALISHPQTQIELMATAGENPALIALMADLALA
jgi:sirohydrochlorin cobaltochelatase